MSQKDIESKKDAFFMGVKEDWSNVDRQSQIKSIVERLEKSVHVSLFEDEIQLVGYLYGRGILRMEFWRVENDGVRPLSLDEVRELRDSGTLFSSGLLYSFCRGEWWDDEK